MAVYFRHGSNGAYKTAYVVWFEILPALRNGRLVITNIEGLKPKESIEEILGEKFPPGAELIRIFTRSTEGVELWQNWYSWMPIGALVIIDECQDIFSADVGFKREKSQYQPFEKFEPLLPRGFSELFHGRWQPVDPNSFDDGDTDDTGRTQLDSKNRLLYPFNFYGAFMRHRKYQWDVIMLTPDWTSIPTWLRGCAQEAYSHRSTDTFFRKRKPRIFNHRPNSSKTAPSSKADYASCSSKKIPVDVFALYQSTGTGGFNESKSDISILKSPKFILVILIGIGAMGKFIWDLTYVLSDSSENPAPATSQEITTNTQTNTAGDGIPVGVSSPNTKASNGVATRHVDTQDVNPVHSDLVNPFYEAFSMFNDAEAVYLTAVSTTVNNRYKTADYLFRVDTSNGSYYLRSEVLASYGYRFKQIDDCLVLVESSIVSQMLTCPPNPTMSVAQAAQNDNDKMEELRSQVDIFNM
ncbi:zonular occludens toxin [Vibrio scophthalmi]|uniref:zonular occludens toxin domain-containing protein n=1 Tax=Vibrio scophthalmi TaxID=45658 RepID=UPI002284B0F1|nr:zonular occludens toxin domain-containing protein [Vibrio scophthalmi]MCY9803345.1 zonular occludens toxin [Vibrio scophthalmi]